MKFALIALIQVMAFAAHADWSYSCYNTYSRSAVRITLYDKEHYLLRYYVGPGLDSNDKPIKQEPSRIYLMTQDSKESFRSSGPQVILDANGRVQQELKNKASFQFAGPADIPAALIADDLVSGGTNLRYESNKCWSTR